MIDQEVRRELTEASAGTVRFSGPELAAARSDRSGKRSLSPPWAVATPQSVAAVQAVHRVAFRHSIPIVPRGAGTGLAGGAIAESGQIVLALTAMNRVLEISADDELAVVQAGIINADLNAQLLPHNLWFSPDPASSRISSIGGNIATNAGGLLCAKYGDTRQSVLGLTAVLADGTLIEVGHRTIKGVAGFDLTSLLVGSEGALATIVEATLRLRRAGPRPVSTVGATFGSIGAASRASSSISARGIRPALMELMDAHSITAVDEYLGVTRSGARDAMLIVQLDGPGHRSELATVLEIIREAGGEADPVEDNQRAEELLEFRRAVNPALERRGSVLVEDVAVPRSELPAMFEQIDRVSRKYGMAIPTVAHAADGNLHPNFIYDASDGEVPSEIWAAADELFTAALGLGGTLTGEHGVGLLKKRWLRAELGDEVFALQQRIKHAFDPTGIMNPGKVFS